MSLSVPRREPGPTLRAHLLWMERPILASEELICISLLPQVSGLPTPDLTWLLDGKPVRQDSAHKMLVRENGVHSLVIEPVSARDAGIYTCVATNRAGQNSFSLELLVAGRLGKTHSGREETQQRPQCEKSFSLTQTQEK